MSSRGGGAGAVSRGKHIGGAAKQGRKAKLEIIVNGEKGGGSDEWMRLGAVDGMC